LLIPAKELCEILGQPADGCRSETALVFHPRPAILDQRLERHGPAWFTPITEELKPGSRCLDKANARPPAVDWPPCNISPLSPSSGGVLDLLKRNSPFHINGQLPRDPYEFVLQADQHRALIAVALAVLKESFALFSAWGVLVTMKNGGLGIKFFQHDWTSFL